MRDIRRVMSWKFVQAAEDFQDTGIFQGVEDLRPPALVHQEAHVTKDREVVGHRGHIQPDEFRQVRHAFFSSAKRVDDEQAVRVAQSLENIRSLAKISGLLALGCLAGDVNILIICPLSHVIAPSQPKPLRRILVSPDRPESGRLHDMNARPSRSNKGPEIRWR